MDLQDFLQDESLLPLIGDVGLIFDAYHAYSQSESRDVITYPAKTKELVRVLSSKPDELHKFWDSLNPEEQETFSYLQHFLPNTSYAGSRNLRYYLQAMVIWILAFQNLGSHSAQTDRRGIVSSDELQRTFAQRPRSHSTSANAKALSDHIAGENAKTKELEEMAEELHRLLQGVGDPFDTLQAKVELLKQTNATQATKISEMRLELDKYSANQTQIMEGWTKANETALSRLTELTRAKDTVKNVSHNSIIAVDTALTYLDVFEKYHINKLPVDSTIRQEYFEQRKTIEDIRDEIKP